MSASQTPGLDCFGMALTFSDLSFNLVFLSVSAKPLSNTDLAMKFVDVGLSLPDAPGAVSYCQYECRSTMRANILFRLVAPGAMTAAYVSTNSESDCDQSSIGWRPFRDQEIEEKTRTQ